MMTDTEVVLELLKKQPYIIRNWTGEQVREYQDYIDWDELEIWKYGKGFIREFKNHKKANITKWDVTTVNQYYGIKFVKEYFKGDRIIGDLYDFELMEHFE